MKEPSELEELRAQIAGLRVATATLLAPLIANTLGREGAAEAIEGVRAMSVGSRDPMKQGMDDLLRCVLDQVRKLPDQPG